VTLIAGFSSTIFLPLSAWLVQLQGWRPALLSLAVILALGTIPVHALLLRRRTEDLGLHPDGGAAPSTSGQGQARVDVAVGPALRDPSFRWLIVAFCLSTGVAFGLTVHLVPILLDRGFAPTLAAALAGVVGAMQVGGRLLMVPISSRWSLRSVTAGVLGLLPLAIVVLLLVPGLLGVMLFVVLFGAAKGCLTLVRPAFVADMYGRAHYASIAGVLAFAVTLVQAGAPVGAGVAYDRLGGYTAILWFAVLTGILGALAVLPIPSDHSSPEMQASRSAV
jgi:predicted MFS family arabinose efflux permease